MWTFLGHLSPLKGFLGASLFVCLSFCDHGISKAGVISLYLKLILIDGAEVE